MRITLRILDGPKAGQVFPIPAPGTTRIKAGGISLELVIEENAVTESNSSPALPPTVKAPSILPMAMTAARRGSGKARCHACGDSSREIRTLTHWSEGQIVLHRTWNLCEDCWRRSMEIAQPVPASFWMVREHRGGMGTVYQALPLTATPGSKPGCKGV